MPQSLVKILVHIVFSTKDRVDIISPEIESELYSYIHGIIENNKAKLVIANGTTNHSHFLISLGRNDVGELTGDIKRDSSLWIKKKGDQFYDFYWQRGYGAFSIGQSQVPEVSRYIAGQKEHHNKQSYEDEFRELCLKYGVEIDERYCWD
jgi:REP element-mobilizing transposase RayT